MQLDSNNTKERKGYTVSAYTGAVGDVGGNCGTASRAVPVEIGGILGMWVRVGEALLLCSSCDVDMMTVTRKTVQFNSLRL